MRYLDLLTPHHRVKPRVEALTAAVLSQAEDLLSLLSALPDALSLDTAAGKQLDLLGALMNIPRPGESVPDGDYRFYLRAKRAAHFWDGTNETLPAVLKTAFPDRSAVLKDNMDGTVTASLSGDAPPFPLTELFPCPAGIRILFTDMSNS